MPKLSLTDTEFITLFKACTTYDELSQKTGLTREAVKTRGSKLRREGKLDEYIDGTNVNQESSKHHTAKPLTPEEIQLRIQQVKEQSIRMFSKRYNEANDLYRAEPLSKRMTTPPVSQESIL